MAETKENIYYQALKKLDNLAVDAAMDFEDSADGGVDCGEIMDITNKAFADAVNLPTNADESLTVPSLKYDIEYLEKKVEGGWRLTIDESFALMHFAKGMYKQNETLKKALTEIKNAEYHYAEGYNYDSDSIIIEGEECSPDKFQEISREALAAIGGGDE